MGAALGPGSELGLISKPAWASIHSNPIQSKPSLLAKPKPGSGAGNNFGLDWIGNIWLEQKDWEAGRLSANEIARFFNTTRQKMALVSHAA